MINGKIEMRTEMKPRIAFLHAPKTGGTSLHNFMLTAFPENRVCPERFNNFGRYSDEDLQSFDYFSAHMDFRNLQRCANPACTVTLLREPKARILSLYYFWRSHSDEHIEKHNLSGPRLAKRLSLLEMLNWEEDGVPSNFDNYYVRTLLGMSVTGPSGALVLSDEDALRIAMRNLLTFDIVGFLDDMPSVFSAVADRLGVPVPAEIPRARSSADFGRVAGTEAVEREKITPEIDRRLSELVRVDSRLFEAAKAIFVRADPAKTRQG